MKNILYILLFVPLFAFGQSLDSIFLVDGKIEVVELLEINDTSVKYKYPKEVFSINLNTSLILRIKTRTNREINFNSQFVLRKVSSVEDWEKVIITNLPSDIEGLQSIANVTGKAKAISTLGSLEKIQNRAMSKMKMQAAFYGCDFIFMLNQQNVSAQFGSTYSSAQTAESTLSGTAYSSSSEQLDKIVDGKYYLNKVLKLGPNDLKFYNSNNFEDYKSEIYEFKKNLFFFEDNYYTYNHSFDIDNSEAKMRLISSSDSSMVFLLKSIGNQNRFRYYNLCFSTQIIGDNFQIGIDSINAVPGIYLNHLNCDIVQELSKEDVKIKCLNETGRAYDKLVVKKEDLYFHNIDYSWSWELEHNLSEQDSIKLMNSEPGFYYQGIKCIILEELSEIDVKIKYHTETGRGYYRKIVRRTDITEIK